MTHEVHTGLGMDFTFNSIVAEGVRTVDIDDNAPPTAKMLDVTDSAVTTYTEMADPLGNPSPASAKITLECLDSSVGYADNKLVKQALNTSAALAFAISTDANDNEWGHAGIELLSRTTTIKWEDVATVSYEFGANTAGAWGEVT